MSASAAVQKLFISSPRFAVLGASVDRAKYGNKVLRWYQAHNLPVVPINSKVDEIEGVRTVASLEELESPMTTALSIITPPAITLNALRQVKDLGIPYVWIQPGAADSTVSDYIQNNGLGERVVHSGPCILVLGESLLANASRL
ncbi:NAD(P)-binding protein [Serendipita vermifera]|nr:NAD(P)-binding protein [Serendipita vermifera]